MAQSRRQFLAALTAAFFGSALIRRVTPAEINPSWLTAKPLPPSEGIALDWWSQVGDEALRILEGELRCLRLMGTEPEYRVRIGHTMHVREPSRFEPEDRFDPFRPILQTTHPVLLDRIARSDLHLREDVRDWPLKRFSDCMIQPAMIAMAGHIFDQNRGADLIVTAPLVLPPAEFGVPAVILASSKRLHLRAITGFDPVTREKLVRFEMLHGALRT